MMVFESDLAKVYVCISQAEFEEIVDFAGLALRVRRRANVID